MKTPVKSQIDFNSAPALHRLIPNNRQVVSCLMFTGQLECELSFLDVDFICATNRYAVYEFWECLIKDAYRIADIANSLHQQMDPQLVYIYQNDWPRFKDPFFRSALFFLLNKYSNDGSISHGSFNTNNYSAINSRSLINFVEHNDIHKIKLKYYKAEKYYEGFDNIKKEQILFLPIGKYSLSPLVNQTLVGHEKYDFHERTFKKLIHEYQKDFIAVYKYHPRLMLDYKKFNTLMVNKVGELTNNNNAADEVIVTNMGINHVI